MPFLWDARLKWVKGDNLNGMLSRIFSIKLEQLSSTNFHLMISPVQCLSSQIKLYEIELVYDHYPILISDVGSNYKDSIRLDHPYYRPYCFLS